MKKIILITFFAFACSSLLVAQRSYAAIGGYLQGFFPEVQNHIDDRGPVDRTMGHMFPMVPGIRLEFGGVFRDYPWFVPTLYSFGISNFFPHTDSAFFKLTEHTNFEEIGIAGKARTTGRQICVRFGFVIPQPVEMLILHVGVGVGFISSKTKYILPHQSTAFPYTASNFYAKDLEPIKRGGVAGELFAGLLYEFPLVSFIGQYSMIVENENKTGEAYRHGFNIGIIYPMKELYCKNK